MYFDAFENVDGLVRRVTPMDQAFRAGLALGRGEGGLGLDADDVPLAPGDCLDPPDLHDAFVRGYEAARWEVEGSSIAA